MKSLVNSSVDTYRTTARVPERRGVVPDRVQQVGLAQPGAAVDEQRVVRLRRRLGDRDRRGVGEPVGRADDERLERVLRVEPVAVVAPAVARPARSRRPGRRSAACPRSPASRRPGRCSAHRLGPPRRGRASGCRAQGCLPCMGLPASESRAGATGWPASAVPLAGRRSGAVVGSPLASGAARTSDERVVRRRRGGAATVDRRPIGRRAASDAVAGAAPSSGGRTVTATWIGRPSRRDSASVIAGRSRDSITSRVNASGTREQRGVLDDRAQPGQPEVGPLLWRDDLVGELVGRGRPHRAEVDRDRPPPRHPRRSPVARWPCPAPPLRVGRPAGRRPTGSDPARVTAC